MLDRIYNCIVNLNHNVIMKKIRDTKQIRRNNPNFFKYMHGAPILQTLQQQKLHARSMVQFQPNLRYQQSARQVSNNNKQNHHSSLCNHVESQQLQSIKSKSLKKFLNIFGNNSKTNCLIAPATSSMKIHTSRQDKKGICNTNRQVFTCNIKNMNVNVSNSKQKDIRDNRSGLIIKKDKIQNNTTSVRNIIEQDERILKLRRSIEDYKLRQVKLKERVEQLQNENKEMKTQMMMLVQQKNILQEKYAEHDKELQNRLKLADKKIQQFQKSLKRDKCKEHQLIIQSLKKVINEQLRKIIQLEKFKIEREEIDKLEERINQNMIINAHADNIKQKTKTIESLQPIKMKRKQSNQIKIQDQSFDESSNSHQDETHLYQSIQEVNEEYEQSNCKVKQPEDSILEQVDKYLSQWRNKY